MLLQCCSVLLHPIQDKQCRSIMLTTMNNVDKILFSTVTLQALGFVYKILEYSSRGFYLLYALPTS